MEEGFIKVCRESDIEEGRARIIEVNGREVLLAREGGEIYGLGAYCSHDGGRMEVEEVYDGQVECPRHGAMFDIRTGKATMMPAVYGIATYEVRVENGDVYVNGKNEST